jgi:ribonucleoside-diphosphate reductase alpha chain
MGKEVRNATMSSIAPTGTLSLVADTSSGIEPVFSLVYERRSFYQDEGKENRESLLYVNKEFEEYAKEKGFYSKELMQKIADNHGILKGIDEVPDEAKRIFVTTHDIEPNWHVAMQSAAQSSVDAAVSKTINLPNDAKVEDIKNAYIDAWELGCKGITIYRDGSKQFQVLENVSKKEEKNTETKSNVDVIKFVANKKHELTANALQVLEKRAFLKDENNNIIETEQQLWQRIARHIASAEKPERQDDIANKFFEVMNNGEFYCGGTLLWAGMGQDTILSKCLVLPIEDSIDSIFRTLNWNIQCLRRGVGTGFNFSKIRSTYARVSTTGEYAAGPIEYLKMFNRAQDTIKGRGGRGLGSMAILNVDHPNIEEFIECKDDLDAISHYNISVGITDKFMQAVKSDSDWDLIDPSDNQVYKTVKARQLFEKIAKHAWVSGDPGMYFLDTAESTNNTPELGKMDATNPCGEQPLIPFETCNMGHINLSNIVNGFPYIDNDQIGQLTIDKKLEYIDWARLEEVTKIAVRFLDNIIDINNYPIDEIAQMTKKTRNIGVGVMGYADLLIKLGIAYGSAESIKVIEKVMEFIQSVGREYSVEIGKEKGNFPAFEQSNWYQEGYQNMRNVRVTTIAPTGTISIIANCNPGIEPIFALGYRRKNSMGNTDQEVIEHLFEQVAKAKGFYSTELIAEIADGKHLDQLAQKYNIPADVVNIFKTTHEISPMDHVEIQSAFQEYVDSAVSKTINLPNTATWQEIAKVYQKAYEKGCKGITIFRDGSKDPALQVGTKDKKIQPESQNITVANVPVQQNNVEPQRNILEPRKRDDVVKGFTYKVNTEQGALFVTVNEDDKGVFELFLNLGKSGSYTAGYTQAIGRLISNSLRSGIKIDSIIEQLQGIRTSAPTMNKGMIVYSVPDAIAKILKRHIEERKNQMKLLSEKEFEVQPVIDIKDIQIQTPIIESTKVTENFESQTVSISELSESKIEVVIEQSQPSIVNTEDNKKYSSKNSHGDLLECPDCSGDLEYAEGCILCRSCGFSKCG